MRFGEFTPQHVNGQLVATYNPTKMSRFSQADLNGLAHGVPGQLSHKVMEDRVDFQELSENIAVILLTREKIRVFHASVNRAPSQLEQKFVSLRNGLSTYSTCRQRLSQVFANPVRPLKTIKRVHQILAPDSKYGFRHGLASLGGTDFSNADHVAPLPEKIQPMMRDWIEFSLINDDRPWIRVCLSFAQFIHIHPFQDGNGRFARCFYPLLAVKLGISQLESALVWLYQHTLGEAALLKSLRDLRFGSVNNYLICWARAIEWANDEIEKLEGTSAMKKNDSLEERLYKLAVVLSNG